MARFAWVLGLAPFLCQCDPAMTIKGSVHRTDETPVAGASVSTDCSGEGSSYGDVSAITKKDGSFSGEGLGSVNDECTLEVIIVTEPIYKFRALKYCANHDDVGCTDLEADLVIPLPPTE